MCMYLFHFEAASKKIGSGGIAMKPLLQQKFKFKTYLRCYKTVSRNETHRWSKFWQKYNNQFQHSKFAGCDLERADTKELYEVFLNYATVERNGEKHITSEDFVRKFLGLYDEENYNEASVQLIAGIVDMDKDGYISFSEFQAFEGLLCVPDALYKTAFLLFDTNGNGLIDFSEFVKVMEKTTLHERLPLNMDTPFVQLYFGKDKKRLVSYPEFCQFLHDFQEECGVEVFKKRDLDETGFIGVRDFWDIMLTFKSHLLTKDLKNKVINASLSSEQNEHKISFPYYMAFNSLLNNMDVIKRVYLTATNGSYKREVTKDEFLHFAQMMSRITPLEVDILFSLCDTIHHCNGRIVYRDLHSITTDHYFKHVPRNIAKTKADGSLKGRSVLTQVSETVYRFTLGSIAGGVGAAAVYPLDLVKTRMQNQRYGKDSKKKMYKNSWDCFMKIIRLEGVLGLYRGLLPQLVGVSPEKAVKLTANGFFRDQFMDKNGHVSKFGEFFAGGCAGACQVLFTNPLEVVKIRLQMAGEVEKTEKAMRVIRQLGLRGLYRGAQACILRDIFFNSIYFGVYAIVKARFADKNGYNNPQSLLASGAVAGIPAAGLVTPFDVIKTRLQVVPRVGHTRYYGVIDATTKIWREEGGRAFWKGTLARVIRTSPQFGVMLLTYEILQRMFYIDFGGSRPEGSERKPKLKEEPKQVKHIGGYQMATPVLIGLETKFGIFLPRFGSATDKVIDVMKPRN